MGDGWLLQGGLSSWGRSRMLNAGCWDGDSCGSPANDNALCLGV